MKKYLIPVIRRRSIYGLIFAVIIALWAAFFLIKYWEYLSILNIIWIIAAALLIIWQVKAYKFFMGAFKPTSSPMYKRLAWYGDCKLIEKEIDIEVNRSDVKKMSSFLFTNNWIINEGGFIEVYRTIDLMWMYLINVKRRNDINLTVPHRVCLVFRNGGIIETRKMSKKKAQKIFDEIHKVYPWVICGYGDEMVRLWSIKREAVINQIDLNRIKAIGVASLSEINLSENIKTVEINGVKVPVSNNINELCKFTDRYRMSALRIRIKDYMDLVDTLANYYRKKYGMDSSFYNAINGSLICYGCNSYFPGSYVLSLSGFMGGNSKVVGATKGYEEFGKKAKCPYCTSEEALYVYDNISPAEITEMDVQFIQGYWRSEAEKWWNNNPGKVKGICDDCASAELYKGDGYLSSGTHVICERCKDNILQNAFQKLKSNPSCFGNNTVRMARYWWSQVGPNSFDLKNDIKTERETSQGQNHETKYVDECFNIDIIEMGEDRDLVSSQEVKDINSAYSAGNKKQALKLAERLLQSFPDHSLPFFWVSDINSELGKHEEARQYLFQGIKNSRSKVTLCSRLGKYYMNQNNINEAVKWWIISVVLQIRSKYAVTLDPFLYLAYIAQECKLYSCGNKLFSYVDSIRDGQIRLNANEANNLCQFSRNNRSDAILDVLNRLENEYLVPNPPDVLKLETIITNCTRHIEKGEIEALCSRASTFIDKKDYENAIKDYSEYLRHKPNNYTYYKRAQAHALNNNMQLAIADYKMAAQMGNDDASECLKKLNIE